jgi:hypothetical protein
MLKITINAHYSSCLLPEKSVRLLAGARLGPDKHPAELFSAPSLSDPLTKQWWYRLLESSSHSFCLCSYDVFVAVASNAVKLIMAENATTSSAIEIVFFFFVLCTAKEKELCASFFLLIPLASTGYW